MFPNNSSHSYHFIDYIDDRATMDAMWRQVPGFGRGRGRGMAQLRGLHVVGSTAYQQRMDGEKYFFNRGLGAWPHECEAPFVEEERSIAPYYIIGGRKRFPGDLAAEVDLATVSEAKEVLHGLQSAQWYSASAARNAQRNLELVIKDVEPFYNVGSYSTWHDQFQRAQSILDGQMHHRATLDILIWRYKYRLVALGEPAGTALFAGEHQFTDFRMPLEPPPLTSDSSEEEEEPLAPVVGQGVNAGMVVMDQAGDANGANPDVDQDVGNPENQDEQE